MGTFYFFLKKKNTKIQNPIVLFVLVLTGAVTNARPHDAHNLPGLSPTRAPQWPQNLLGGGADGGVGELFIAVSSGGRGGAGRCGSSGVRDDRAATELSSALGEADSNALAECDAGGGGARFGTILMAELLPDKLPRGARTGVFASSKSFCA